MTCGEKKKNRSEQKVCIPLVVSHCMHENENSSRNGRKFHEPLKSKDNQTLNLSFFFSAFFFVLRSELISFNYLAEALIFVGSKAASDLR